MKNYKKKITFFDIIAVPLAAFMLYHIFFVGPVKQKQAKQEQDHKIQQIITAQTATVNYDYSSINNIVKFDYFQDEGPSFLLKSSQNITDTEILQLNNILSEQKTSSQISDYQIIKTYTISGGKTQSLYSHIAIIITK